MTLRTDGFCRACGAPIAWRRTVNDKPMPIDPVPHPSGNVLIQRNGRVIVLRDPPELRLRRSTGPLYRSHWATCPFADRFRRGKAGDARR